MPPTALSESRIIDGESEDDPITINELQEIARRKLPKKNFYEYYECGADDQVALGKNRKDFDR
jgi:(S)-2-hydroxy-acid oxidase